ncbi:unnamed protein product [marine sediment metagenome]|uniref:Uncharacterized protein n=1 Tax=marine sediment metagenome TaxID=412755 RepID=X0SE67_9ZZZZ
MGREDDVTRNVVKGVNEEENRERGGEDIVTLSSGVRLKIRAVPRNFIFAVTAKFEKPKVPRYMNEQKGKEEENPNDPNYLDATEKYLLNLADASNNVVLLRGTEIVGIPDDVPGPDSKQWKEEMTVLEMSMIDNKRARYLAWVKGIAAPLESDINGLFTEIGRLTGVSEEDVAQAAERFRSTQEQ